MDNKRVVVAMSGGVDSSLVAALLVRQGYDVIGMMLRLWSEPGKEAENRCCTPDSMAQARRVASLLSIPFYAIDAQDIFFKEIVQPFIHSYLEGDTPNPCLICNRKIRWGYLLDHAIALGAGVMATGHYVRTAQDAQGNIQLLKGIDKTKDQSYVLHGLNQTQLSRSIFPLGEYSKTDVRKMAMEFNLPVANREESQDLCFLADNDYRSFILRNNGDEINPGLIKNLQGEILGEHNGLPFYTIGQRKGLNIYSSSPYYVIKKDTSNNILIVGKNDQRSGNEVIVDRLNWIAGTPPDNEFSADVMVRYRTRPMPCIVKLIDQAKVLVNLLDPVNDITPGQAAVFYQDDLCLGGGTII